MIKFSVYIVSIVILISLIFFSGLQTGIKIERTKWEQSQNEALISYAKTIKEGEEQHDKDQMVIDGLNTKLNSLPKLHFPINTSCPNGTSKDSNTGAGTLSKRVDEAFGNLQTGVSSLIKQCDQLNIDAIRSNAK